MSASTKLLNALHFNAVVNTDYFIWSTNVLQLFTNSSIRFSSSTQREVTFQGIYNNHHVCKVGGYMIELLLLHISFFLPLYHLFPDLRSWKTVDFNGLTSWPARNITCSDARNMEYKTSISYDDRTVSSAKVWTGSGFNLSSFCIPSFSIAISTIGRHFLYMINKNINALRRSPALVLWR